jgi:hypothetical protein
MQITVDLPERLYQHLQNLAEMSDRSVNEIIDSIMSLSLLPLHIPETDVPIEELSDDIILQLAESRMNPVQSELMSDLLNKQQAAELSQTEKDLLSMLVYIYEQGSLLKAQALRVAVQRGLREPLSP